MPGLDLRPLSMGEILDRTFSLYRRHFLLFLGISGIPHAAVLAFGLAQSALTPTFANPLSTTLILTGVSLIISLFAYLFSQGGTILAVSELYLGRGAAITESLRRVWDDIGSLFGVILLNGLAVGGATILLIVPGIYVACRLMVCVPVAMIEKRGPSDSFSRSFDLTRDNAGRAFVILVLSVVLTWAAQLLFGGPFTLGMMLSKDPSTILIWTMLIQVGASAASVLVNPILLIATAVFYYDLRVRKEAFDLQFMLDPNSQRPPGTSGIPSILS